MLHLYVYLDTPSRYFFWSFRIQYKQINYTGYALQSVDVGDRVSLSLSGMLVRRSSSHAH